MATISKSLIRRPYKLGKGGIHGRFEGGVDKAYKPGDTIYMTDSEYRVSSVKSRLTRVEGGQAQVDAGELASALDDDTAQATKAPTTKPAEAKSVTLKPEAAKAPKDWGKLLSLTAAPDLLKLLPTLDIDELRELRDAERAGKKRRSVINAANVRVRALAAAARKEAKQEALDNEELAEDESGEEPEDGVESETEESDEDDDGGAE